MSNISPLARKAVEQARRGELESALATAKEAIAEDPNDKGIRFFAALLHSKRDELAEAAQHLSDALALEPGDGLVRAELVRTLIGIGDLDTAEGLLSEGSVPARQERRLRAMLCGSRGQHELAAGLYREIVGADPRDFESWGNLGISLLAIDDAVGAVAAFEQSLRLRPGNSKLMGKWGEAQVRAGTAEDALARLYQQGKADPSALLTAARIEDLEGRPERATAALRSAIESQRGNASALVALAELQERANDVDGLEATLQELERQSQQPEKLPLLRARAAYRRQDFDLALRLAEGSPANADPAARAQLLGQIHDRIGEPGAAFPYYEQMNALDSAATEGATGRANRYLDGLRERMEVLTPEWTDRWPAAPEPRNEPVFLVGFPRSGTTLLDTLLSSESRLAISEENPLLSNVSKRIGAFERIADLEPAEIEELRELYFAEARKYVPGLGSRILVDKFPLGLAAAPLIHRLFPNAKILFLARHPCDVVLSCFTVRFEPTDLGSAFLTLSGAARLYDSTMAIWSKSRELLPMRILDVRYETLVVKPRMEMKKVAEFMNIPWSENLVDNRPAAEKRGFIKTPSYSQVSEPIYKRAVERWRNYSEELGPVLPILKPWIEALGYEA
jgi:tetratricopeptide (TPR) repeat protein